MRPLQEVDILKFWIKTEVQKKQYVLCTFKEINLSEKWFDNSDFSTLNYISVASCRECWQWQWPPSLGPCSHTDWSGCPCAGHWPQGVISGGGPGPGVWYVSTCHLLHCQRGKTLWVCVCDGTWDWSQVRWFIEFIVIYLMLNYS